MRILPVYINIDQQNEKYTSKTSNANELDRTHMRKKKKVESVCSQCLNTPHVILS